ncbi:MAG: DNA methylase [Actinomycetota bacterium]|nr:DNA methylase [Actinomycetota bacterium]
MEKTPAKDKRAARERKGIYSKDLQIDLTSKKEEELFKWLLACLLFGKPIQQEVAKRTYFEFVKADLTTPETIMKAGWERLVEVLGKGHYVHYDFSTATKLLEISKELKEKYGTVTALITHSKTPDELSQRLQEFKDIGPVTARIFIRDIQNLFWR